MESNCTRYIILFLAIGINACSLKQVAVISDTKTSKSFSFKLIDERIEEKRSSFLTKGGNIYSCHYGIKLLENEEIVPERLIYLSNQLDSIASEQLKGKTFSVQRFTIYINRQIEHRRGATASISGGIAGGLSVSGNNIPGVVIWGNSLLLNQPGVLVGCKENYTGAYLTSELNGGKTPIVLYFEGKMDNLPISLRIVQPAGKNTKYEEQVRKSINLLAKAIINKLNSET